jgi:hypothetical protein
MAIDPEILGKTIADIRQLCELTQRSVAEHIGVAVNYVSMLGATRPFHRRAQPTGGCLRRARGVDPVSWRGFSDR